ncbi:MAG TPA: fluoride efflux transporter CrcB [Gammaproteobacteria bacterium]|nr:fluoride efflux transporter CrcB [Gammaproteobacteria bacterium]
MFQSIAAISVGASTGAVMRWMLSNKLNPVLTTLPLGTLASNLIGGYLIGVAIAWFSNNPSLAPEWRLLIITGFLGGLTTFSSFSAEVVTLLQENRLGWAFTTMSAHVAGSLVMTALGIGTVALFMKT